MNDVQRLKKSGNWMVRFSRNGIGYAGYIHAPIGQWAECPGWTNSAKCDGGGFFGQTMQYCGYRHDRLDIEIAEHGGGIKVIDGNKVAVRRMCILARGQDAMDMLAELCGGEWPGSLNIKEDIRCDLTSIGVDAYIYAGASVPALTSIGGHASIYAGASVPALTSIGGSAYISEGASVPALTSIGCSAYIHEGASVPNLKTVNGEPYHA